VTIEVIGFLVKKAFLILALIAAPFLLRIADEFELTTASESVSKVVRIEKLAAETITTIPVNLSTDPQNLIIMEPLRKLIDGN
jgi:hypothetical protein